MNNRDDLEKQMGNFVKAFTTFELVCHRYGLDETNETIALFAVYVDVRRSKTYLKEHD